MEVRSVRTRSCTGGCHDSDVIVIGAGASGLMCAATAGARGRSVLVLDHAERDRREDPHLGRRALQLHQPRRHRRALPVGQRALLPVRPRPLHAAPPARPRREARHPLPRARGRAALLRHQRAGDRRDAAGGVRRRGRQHAARLPGRGDRRERRAAASPSRPPGGRSGARPSSSPPAASPTPSSARAVSGTMWRGSSASPSSPPRPALVPFVFAKADREIFRELAGVSLDAAITCGGKRHAGKILFTHRGLSGPAALQASLLWAPGESAEHRPAAGHGHPRRAARAAAGQSRGVDGARRASAQAPRPDLVRAARARPAAQPAVGEGR